MAKKQEQKLIMGVDIGIKNPVFVFAIYHEDSNTVAIQSCTMSPREASNAADALKIMADSCNVATPKLISPKTFLFDSSKEPGVYTLEVDNKTLTDFQKLKDAEGEDIRKTLLALINYHNEHDSFNLILLHDVLETRQSYTKFTAQLGNYLTHGQEKYTQIKVQFDSLTSRLGIFCRLGSPGSTLNSSFLGSITASLSAYSSAEILTEDIPMSYLGNRAALKFQLTQRLGKKPILEWTKHSLKVFI